MGDSTPGQGPSDGARGLRRIMEEILERPQVFLYGALYEVDADVL